jgi:hypothetical protein
MACSISSGRINLRYSRIKNVPNEGIGSRIQSLQTQPKRLSGAKEAIQSPKKIKS